MQIQAQSARQILKTDIRTTELNDWFTLIKTEIISHSLSDSLSLSLSSLKYY